MQLPEIIIVGNRWTEVSLTVRFLVADLFHHSFEAVPMFSPRHADLTSSLDDLVPTR